MWVGVAKCGWKLSGPRQVRPSLLYETFTEDGAVVYDFKDDALEKLGMGGDYTNNVFPGSMRTSHRHICVRMASWSWKGSRVSPLLRAHVHSYPNLTVWCVRAQSSTQKCLEHEAGASHRRPTTRLQCSSPTANCECAL